VPKKKTCANRRPEAIEGKAREQISWYDDAEAGERRKKQPEDLKPWLVFFGARGFG
jgi:hypothetical protein